MARTVPLLAALALLVPLEACSVDELLEVTDPDIVNPKDLQSEAGAAAAFAGGVGDFSLAVVGNNGGTEGQILVSGMMADEYIHSGTFPTRLEYELRAINVRNGTLDGVFRNLQRARVSLEEATGLLQEYNPDADMIGEAFALAGYTYIFFGENYCGGVPFSSAAGLGSPLTTDEIFRLAIERFDTALTYVSTGDVANLARVGKARALVNLADYAAAALALVVDTAFVPTNFVYQTTHTTTTGRQQNGVHVFNWLSERWSVADNEGGAGLNFRTAGDPRVSSKRDIDAIDTLTFTIDTVDGVIDTALVTDTTFAVGFDESTPQWDLRKYPERTTPVPIANGVEARLIEAEAILQSSGGGDMLGALNDLRADAANNGGFDLAPLADPDSLADYEDLLFRERAFWLYATGHRLGDLRRLMRDYQREAAEVYPTGNHPHKGASYGTDLSLPVPESEINNPNFTRAACSTTTP